MSYQPRTVSRDMIYATIGLPPKVRANPSEVSAVGPYSMHRTRLIDGANSFNELREYCHKR